MKPMTSGVDQDFGQVNGQMSLASALSTLDRHVTVLLYRAF
jgi:hypothetical protein